MTSTAASQPGFEPGSNLTPRMVAAAVFDTLIADFDGVVQEMTVAFAVSRWPSVTLEAWVYDQDGQHVAAALVMLQQLPLRSAQLAVVKWGPILAHEGAPDREAIHAAAVAHLQLEYAHRRRMMLSIMARAERPPLLNAPQRLAASGFRVGSKLLFPNRYLVNLRLSDPDQRKSFSQKWRYHLSKSERVDLELRAAEPAALAIFDGLYTAMSDRKRFDDSSAYNTVQSLFASPAASLRPQLFLVWRHNVPVAGAIVFTAGKTAVYLYGATNDDALRLRAGYFLHAKIISWLRDNTRADWYDLGGTDGFQGLHQFKKGMVGSAGLISPVPAIVNYATHVPAKVMGTAAYQMRDGLQHIRRFINRHRRNMARPDQGSDT